MKFKEGDLVMTREESPEGYTKFWWRVMFIDSDETFIGELEKFDRALSLRCELNYKKGDHVRFFTDEVKSVYKEGEQFCYGDQVTICECPALCRNK